VKLAYQLGWLAVVHKGELNIWTLAGYRFELGELLLAVRTPGNPDGEHGGLSALQLYAASIQAKQLSLRQVPSPLRGGRKQGQGKQADRNESDKA
jgi:hypothetical protein